MNSRLSSHPLLQGYPSQFWLLFAGLLISTVGASMIWPFLMIYASQTLNQPLTVVAGLMTLNSAMGLIFSFLAGPLIDRAGRKWVMAVSLAVNGAAYLLLSRATTLTDFAILMGLSGAFNPLYRVGADAMMADLVPAERRADAYSLLRTSNNIGVALGPAIGGLIASRSYDIAFYMAAAGMIAYSLLVSFLAKETLPQFSTEQKPAWERFGGYGRILQDRAFIYFCLNFTLTQICAAVIWVLLGVYVKTQHGIPESRYGLIPMTNALMVIFLQLSVTRVSKRYPPLLALALGSLFYAVAVTSVGFGKGFWAFLASMVVLTVGELILSPIATTYAANLAPTEMRGRYMSLYGLTWGVAAGIGPVLGGMLNDQVSPQATWFGAGLVGLVSVMGFLLLARRERGQLSRSKQITA